MLATLLVVNAQLKAPSVYGEPTPVLALGMLLDNMDVAPSAPAYVKLVGLAESTLPDVVPAPPSWLVPAVTCTGVAVS
jgi:hypothetical protein